LLLFVAPNLAPAADAVRTRKGTLTGTINQITPQQIVLTRPGGKKQTIPVNEVVSVRFDGEPSQLSSARNQISGGEFAAALATLAKLEAEGSASATVQQEINYYKAFAAAQQALSGAGDIQSAGRNLRSWVEANRNSYHWYEANELLGDLIVKLGRNNLALSYYDRVQQAPWPNVKMRAQIAKGRAMLASGQAAEAGKAFAAAEQMAEDSNDPLVARQKQAAKLGAAAALAEAGDYEKAVQQAEDVIAVTDPEDVKINAQAYNTLGLCLRKAGRPKEALLAFLHVDLLYFTDPRAHAEALRNLAELWVKVDQPQRAVEAEQILKDRYGKK